jgi:hypothetical protein
VESRSSSLDVTGRSRSAIDRSALHALDSRYPAAAKGEKAAYREEPSGRQHDDAMAPAPGSGFRWDEICRPRPRPRAPFPIINLPYPPYPPIASGIPLPCNALLLARRTDDRAFSSEPPISRSARPRALRFPPAPTLSSYHSVPFRSIAGARRESFFEGLRASARSMPWVPC